MKRRLSNIVLVICVIAGAALLLYPTVSEMWNRARQSGAEVEYTDQLRELDDASREKMWEDARDYNARLAAAARGEAVEELGDYDDMLNVTDEGTMAVVWIPKIDVKCAVRHGMDEGMLQHYVGHFPTSSLPVGGKDTHCVLMGHRGLPSAKLFTDLDLIEVGDVFVVETLGEKLAYEVEDISTVLPNETESLAIVDGRDLCTLVTCTPYGINSHRLLLRGHRTEWTEELSEEMEEASESHIEPLWIVAGIVAVALLVLACLARPRKRKGNLPQADESEVDSPETPPEDGEEKEDSQEEDST